MNRYIYDLSQGGGSASLGISDTTGSTPTFAAYGNLYKTQEYLPTVQSKLASLSHGQYSTGSWSDVRGTSFDALDRPISKYELAYGSSAVTTITYDSNGQNGLLSKTINALGQVTKYIYDSNDHVTSVNFSGTAPLADSRTYAYDADARTTAAVNSLGSLSYAYDVDGNTKSVTEPANEPAASLICYDYYGDGLRKDVSIGPSSVSNCNSIAHNLNPSNGGISQPQIFSYAYRNDGPLVNQHVAWGTSSDFVWTYTPSERELSEQDPLYGTSVPGFGSIVKKTYAYDSFGRVQDLKLPEGFDEASPAYDGGDELVGYNPTQGSTSITRQFVLNARGEMLEDATNTGLFGWAQGPTSSGNGSAVGNGDTTQFGGNLQAPPTVLQFDVRSGMETAGPDPAWASLGLTGADVFSYDAAGRRYKETYWANWPNGSGTDPQTASFDAENHLNDPSNLTWGPDLRHRVETVTVAGSQLQATAHWDGSAILFATEGQAGPTLYIGKYGVADAAGDLYVSDRDESGTEQTSHGSVFSGPWYNSWSPGSVRNLQIYKTGNQLSVQLFQGSCGYTLQVPPYTSYPCPTFAPTFAMKRSDGYSMYGGITQGARTMDPVSGQWLTPDAYAGDVNDPMSQKPFIWNSNNPLADEDPSGYDAIFEGSGGVNAQPLTTDYYGGDPGALIAIQNTVVQALEAANKTADRNNGTYSKTDAAKAASAKFFPISMKYGLEIGCEIYCMKADTECSYTSGVVGTATNVRIDVTDFTPIGAHEVGYWHSHPTTSALSSLDDHQEKMQLRIEDYAQSGISVGVQTTYTTLSNGQLRGQDYVGPQSLSETGEDSYVVR